MDSAGYAPIDPEVWQRAGFDRCTVKRCKVWIDRASSQSDICKCHRAMRRDKRRKER
jgi:hypothetical protein